MLCFVDGIPNNVLGWKPRRGCSDEGLYTMMLGRECKQILADSIWLGYVEQPCAKFGLIPKGMTISFTK